MANEFTYASSARPMRATSSFQDLLDAERQKTVQAIAAAPAQTAAAVAGPGLADARTNEGGGGDGGSTSSPGTGKNSDGSVSTGLGGYSSAFGSTTATANTTGVSNTNAARAGGLALGPVGSLAFGFANNAINSRANTAAAGFNSNMADAISHSAPDAPDAMADDGRANQAAAEAAAAADGYGSGDGGNSNGGGNDSQNTNGRGGIGDGSGNAGGNDSGRGSQSSEGGRNGGDSGGFAKGGQIGLSDIRQFTAGGPNGPGVDDGLVDSTVGDFILTAQRTKQIGADTLKALSEGRAEIVMLKGGK